MKQKYANPHLGNLVIPSKYREDKQDKTSAARVDEDTKYFYYFTCRYRSQSIGRHFIRLERIQQPGIFTKVSAALSQRFTCVCYQGWEHQGNGQLIIAFVLLSSSMLIDKRDEKGSSTVQLIGEKTFEWRAFYCFSIVSFSP